jgi:uncharacterized protein (DUF433 family)
VEERSISDRSILLCGWDEAEKQRHIPGELVLTLEPGAPGSGLRHWLECLGSYPVGMDSVQTRTNRRSTMTAIASWITKTPDRCGGDACLRDTRITVWGLVAYRRLGMSDTETMQAVQGLTRADLEAAWDYVAAHPQEPVRTDVQPPPFRALAPSRRGP